MSDTVLSNIHKLDLGSSPLTSPFEQADHALQDRTRGAVVGGSLVAFAPGVSELHQQDVLQSLLLAQLAANVKAERHKDPVGWFRAYRSVMEQTAWVVAASSATTRYYSQVARFSVSTILNDVFRRRVTPEELAHLMGVINAFKSDLNGGLQFVFECPSHSGGIGNFQIALVTEEDGVVSIHLAQLSFNAPQHVTRLMLEEFTSTAQFQVGFLVLTQNEQVYAKVRSAIKAKVEGRFQNTVVLFDVP